MQNISLLVLHGCYYRLKQERERGRKETRDEINLGTDLLQGRSQV